MNNRKGLTLTSILNLLLVYCLLRFGLVFTTRWAFWGLGLVVAVGIMIILTNALLNKRYAGSLLQSNVLFLGLNILCVVIQKSLAKDSYYIGLAANYINQLIVLFLLWGFYLYLQRRDLKSQRVLVSIYLLTVAVSAVYTFYVANYGGEYVIRNTAFGEYDSSFRLAYGGFDFIYGLVIVYVVLLTVLSQGRNRIESRSKVIAILMAVLIGTTIVISGYTTAFVLALLATILILPRNKEMKLFFVVCCVFCIYVIPVPITRLIDSLPFIPDITAKRVADMLLSFTGRATSDYFTEESQRWSRIHWTLRVFTNYPLFGVAATDVGNILGGHTEWLEQLARYGIFTAIFNASFWVITYRNVLFSTAKGSITYRCLKNSFFVYLVLGFLNPISMVVTSAPLFVLGPFAENLFVNSSEEEKT